MIFEYKISLSPRTLPVLLFIAFISTPLHALNSTYVGSEQCAECHQQAYSDWKKSDHSHSMASANKESVLGDFNNKVVNFHNIRSKFYQREKQFFVTTQGADGNPHEFRILYTFGHSPLQQYLIETDAGHLQALNVAWDSRSKKQGGQRWFHLQNTEVIDSESAFFWTKHLQNWNSRCAGCHSTNFQKNYDRQQHRYNSTWSEVSVGCEACHGPAGLHLKRAKINDFSAGSGIVVSAKGTLSWNFKANLPIAQASGLASNEHINMCGGCHSRRTKIADLQVGTSYHDQYQLALLDETLYHPDGQIQDEVFVLGSFLQSKMHAKGVTCNNCHQVHSGKLLVEGNALCTQCHLTETYNTPKHHKHTQNSTGAQCVECHMPSTLYMQVDARRDHSFVIPSPNTSMQLNTPNACTTCHAERNPEWAHSMLTQWYGNTVSKPTLAQTHSMARAANPTALEPISSILEEPSIANIVKSTLLAQIRNFPSKQSLQISTKHLTHSDPLMRMAAVRSLENVPPDYQWLLLHRLITDPVKIVRMQVAALLSNSQASMPQAYNNAFEVLITEYGESLRLAEDTPSGLSTLAILALNFGESSTAMHYFEGALDIEPDFVPALLNLADLYRASGNESKVKQLLERALNFAPNSAAVNFSLALHLLRLKQYTSALPLLKKATQEPDSQPRYAYVYAVALDTSVGTKEAINYLNKAILKWQNQEDLLLLQNRYIAKLKQRSRLE